MGAQPHGKHQSRQDLLEMEMKFLAPRHADLQTAKDLFIGMTSEVLRARDYIVDIHYYDTDTLDMLASGNILRRVDDALPHFTAEINIKTKGHVHAAGILVRDEYKFKPRQRGLDLHVIDDPRAIDMLKPAAGKVLREIFRTVNTRGDLRGVFNTQAKNKDPEAAKKIVVEISYEISDFVDAKTNQRFDSTFEIELEFCPKLSDPAITEQEAAQVMHDIGQTLQQAIPGLMLHSESKAERGFRHFTPRIKKSSHKPIRKNTPKQRK